MWRKNENEFEKRLAKYADKVEIKLEDLWDPTVFDGPRCMNTLFGDIVGDSIAYGNGFSSPQNIEIVLMLVLAMGGIKALNRRVSLLEVPYNRLTNSGLFVGYRVHWRGLNFQLVGGLHYYLGRSGREYVEPFSLFVKRDRVVISRFKGKSVSLAFATMDEAVSAITVAYRPAKD